MNKSIISSLIFLTLSSHVVFGMQNITNKIRFAPEYLRSIAEKHRNKQEITSQERNDFNEEITSWATTQNYKTYKRSLKSIGVSVNTQLPLLNDSIDKPFSQYKSNGATPLKVMMLLQPINIFTCLDENYSKMQRSIVKKVDPENITDILNYSRNFEDTCSVLRINMLRAAQAEQAQKS